jgi:hypothetical protein
MTVRELFSKKHRYSRRVRRGITGRSKIPQNESSDDSTSESSSSSSSSSDDDDAPSPGEDNDGSEDKEPSVEREQVNDMESDGTDDYNPNESSSVGQTKGVETSWRAHRRGVSYCEEPSIPSEQCVSSCHRFY